MAEREKAVRAGLVVHTEWGSTSVLDEQGISAHPAESLPTGASAVDIEIRRSFDAELGDLRSTWSSADLADSTRIRVHGGADLCAWGIPAVSPVEVSAGVSATLRLNAAHSPFALRRLSVEVRAARGRLTTRASRGPADLEVDGDWSSIATWISQPEVLFADAFPSAVALRGEIAILSLFEGLLWQVARRAPHDPEVLLRWGRLWGAGAARRSFGSLADALEEDRSRAESAPTTRTGMQAR